MEETEMGNRGSKSITDLHKPASHKSVIVKEQRVDGSWHNMCLRCILMGFERNYQVKIPSKQINKSRLYTSIATCHQSFIDQSEINPWFLTGFTDAEGCFTLSVGLCPRNKKMKVGWAVQAIFQIELSQIDLDLLKRIKSLLGVGNLLERNINGQQSIKYRIQSVKDLKVTLDHFDKYRLISQKRADYELFKQAIRLMEQKEHLTEAGLAKIVALKASMNTGLSEELKLAFPKVIPVTRPLVEDQEIKDPNWLSGFTTGEGCYYINLHKSASHKLKERVKLVFQLSQHVRDLALMQSLVSTLDCGNIYVDNELVNFKITQFKDLTDKVLPFFQKYPLLGVKSKDFEDFCKVAELMQNKAHLTVEGLDQIRIIKAGMNTGRI